MKLGFLKKYFTGTDTSTATNTTADNARTNIAATIDVTHTPYALEQIAKWQSAEQISDNEIKNRLEARGNDLDFGFSYQIYDKHFNEMTTGINTVDGRRQKIFVATIQGFKNYCSAKRKSRENGKSGFIEN